ncbi:MAG: Do family serine endopeptidase [Sedimentisphaerales bacterium]|nr:Do family serine endopeptidase [Sedimentisphaerales bacterium]
MQTRSMKSNRTFFRSASIYLLFLLLIVTPISVFAEDQESVAALRHMGKAFTSIAKKASPAVVSLKAEIDASRDASTSREWPFDDDLFEFFFGPRSPRQRTPRSQPRQSVTTMGSGFIISEDGYILTNNHMVEDAKKVKIELADSRKFDAEIIGTDPESDIAVVKIEAENLPYLELANSDELEVGEWVLAIGNPLSLSHTVTAGIVSAKGRSVGLANFESFIQTDAAINRGNSGGPLLNLDGRVVGINTAIVGATGNIGIGFAIPINMVKYVYKQLREGGSVERGYMGIQFEELSPGVATSLGLNKDTKGVTIVDVVEGSAAADAQLQQYDVIVELNGEPIESGNEFLNHVAMLKPGTKVNLVIMRDGKRKPVTIQLGKRPPTEELYGTLKPETTEELGFTVRDLSDELAERFGYENKKGVIVMEVDPGSQAAEKGISPGTLIEEVNRKPISNTRQFNDEIKKAKKNGGALLLVDLPNGYRKIVFIDFSE